jgi:hypothetical protein
MASAEFSEAAMTVRHSLVTWRPDGGDLRLRFGPSGTATGWADFSTRVAFELSADATVLDLTLLELPEPIVRRLDRYIVNGHADSVSAEVALDFEAGWLWVHLADGVRYENRVRPARARLGFHDGELAELDLYHWLPAERETR